MTTEADHRGASPLQDAHASARPAPGALRLVLRTAFGLLVALVVVTAAGRLFRSEIETVGRVFVDRLGYAGMFGGTFIADAFTFPLPSWFYFVLAVASGTSPIGAVAAVTLGSLLGGCLAYAAAARLAEVRLFRASIASARERLAPLLARHGVWAIVLMGLVPLPFSVSCYVAGSYRIGPRLFGLYLALRVPRLLVFYLLVRLGF